MARVWRQRRGKGWFSKVSSSFSSTISQPCLCNQIQVRNRWAWTLVRVSLASLLAHCWLTMHHRASHPPVPNICLLDCEDSSKLVGTHFSASCKTDSLVLSWVPPPSMLRRMVKRDAKDLWQQGVAGEVARPPDKNTASGASCWSSCPCFPSWPVALHATHPFVPHCPHLKNDCDEHSNFIGRSYKDTIHKKTLRGW